jgi:hypothetical protein
MSMVMSVRRVPVAVRMAHRGTDRRLVNMFMAVVVHMLVRVCYGFMRVHVVMALRHVQPYAQSHQRAGGQQLPGQGVAEQHHGQ